MLADRVVQVMDFLPTKPTALREDLSKLAFHFPLVFKIFLEA